VRLEERLGPGNFTLITQNIDGLHRAAGSQRVLEIHGNLRRVRCSNPSCDFRRIGALRNCRSCRRAPPVIGYCAGHCLVPRDVAARRVAGGGAGGEGVSMFSDDRTSAVVWPAAGLVLLAHDHDAGVIEVT